MGSKWGMERRTLLKTVGVTVGSGSLAAAVGTPAAGEPADNYEQAHWSNYTEANRTKSDINWIVVHVPVMSYQDTISYITTDNDRNVSYHYVVSNYDHTAGPPGEITQLVDPSDRAHHASGVNSHSIGISHEWHSDLGGYITEKCYAASADLIEHLAEQFDIPLEYYDSRTCLPDGAEGGIIGHRHTPRNGACTDWADQYKTCPGPDWNPDQLLEYIDKESDGDDGSDGDQAFDDGDTVITTADLNGREQPGLDSEITTVLGAGTTGEIMNGPEDVDGITWWGMHVSSENVWVWCAEGYLVLADDWDGDEDTNDGDAGDSDDGNDDNSNNDDDQDDRDRDNEGDEVDQGDGVDEGDDRGEGGQGGGGPGFTLPAVATGVAGGLILQRLRDDTEN